MQQVDTTHSVTVQVFFFILVYTSLKLFLHDLYMSGSFKQWSPTSPGLNCVQVHLDHSVVKKLVYTVVVRAKERSEARAVDTAVPGRCSVVGTVPSRQRKENWDSST